MATKDYSSSNPSFDKRILSHPPFTTKLSRGRIVSNDGGPSTRRALNFLYNPSVVSSSHSMDTTAFQPDQQSTNDPGSVFGEAGELSFSLLFDRTYELWDSSYAHTDVGKRGCYVDVLALYKVLNMVAPSSQDYASNALANAMLSGARDIIGQYDAALNSEYLGVRPMQMVQALFFFGTGAYSLRFAGWVTGANVQYTHWNKDMVPMRCTVDVTATISMQSPNYTTPSDPTPTTSNNASGTKSKGSKASTSSKGSSGFGSINPADPAGGPLPSAPTRIGGH